MLTSQAGEKTGGRAEIWDCGDQQSVLLSGGHQYILPAETDIPAPAMTTIFRRFWRTLSSRFSSAVWPFPRSPGGGCRFNRSIVLGLASTFLLFFVEDTSSGSRERFRDGC